MTLTSLIVDQCVMLRTKRNGAQWTAGVYISTLFRNFGYGIVLEFCLFSEKFYVFSKIISEIQQLKKFSRSVLLDKLKKTRKRNQDFLILFGYLNNYPTQLYIVGVNTA